MIDNGTISIMSHISIRDPDQDIELVNKRDAIIRPRPQPPRDTPVSEPDKTNSISEND